MNILIILPWLPYPYDTGGNQAVANAIDAIRYEMNVHLVCIDGEKNRIRKQRLQKDFPNITIDLYKVRHRSLSEYGLPWLIRKVTDRIVSYFNSGSKYFQIRKELSIQMEYDSGWQFYIKELVEEYNIDIIQTEFVNTLGMITVLPQNIRKIFVHHELRYVRNELRINTEEENNEYIPFIRMQKAIELGFLNLYNGVITLSEVDADKLRLLGVSSKIFPSFAVVKNRFRFQLPNLFDNRITFVGPENHEPNRIGVEWFLDKVWSLVLERNSDMCFEIIGNWNENTKKLYKSKYPNVTCLGFVDDLQKALTGSIMIVPIHVGSGIRMKIQEAANMGIPFVTTSVGVEGLPFKDGIDCFIANTPKQFADRIIQMQCLGIQQNFVKSANKLVSEYYSLNHLKKNRMAIYKQILLT